MPFKPIKKGKNKGKYITPSGRIYTEKQMKAYFATQGFKTRLPPGMVRFVLLFQITFVAMTPLNDLFCI